MCVKLTGRDTLDTTTTSETSDSGLGNTLDVVTKNLAVTLGTALAEALATLAACSVNVSQMLMRLKCMEVAMVDGPETRQSPRLRPRLSLGRIATGQPGPWTRLHPSTMVLKMMIGDQEGRYSVYSRPVMMIEVGCFKVEMENSAIIYAKWRSRCINGRIEKEGREKGS